MIKYTSLLRFGVMVLEELSAREKHLRGLVLGEALALRQQIKQPGQDLWRLSGVRLGGVEDPRLLQHRALLDPVERRVLD